MSYEFAKLMNDPLLGPYVPANSDAMGFLEAEIPGLKHVAVRVSSRESTYRPRASDAAPRSKAWAPKR